MDTMLTTTVSLCKGKPISWATLLGGWPVHLRRRSFSSGQPRQDTSGVLGPLLGPSVQGRHGHTEMSTAEGPAWLRAGAHGIQGETLRLGTACLQEKEVVAVYNYLMGEHRNL